MSRHPRRLLPALLLLLPSACTVGPDYQKPVVETGEKFAHASSEYGTGGVDLIWWRRLRDPQLSRLVELAARNNRDLRAAEANLRQARALFLEAGLELLPTVTTHFNWTMQKRSADALNRRTFAKRELRLYNLGFDAFWELDIFGRLRRTVEAREAEVEAAEADRRDILVSLIAEVARNYFELRGHQDQLRIAGRNAASQASTLELTLTRLDAGVGTELDTARARTQLDTTRATIPLIESLILQDIHRLGVLTGQPPAALAGELLEPAPLPAIPEQAAIGKPAELLRRRPDIRGAERSLAAATAGIGIATADLFPRVTFNGTLGLESSALTGIGAAGSEAYSLGPRITWAALDLGQVRARIRAADARAEAELASYEQTVLNALEETENALVAFNRQKVRTAYLASAAAAGEEAHRLAVMRFENGVDDLLTVLVAERSLLEAQRQWSESRTATGAALVALFKALGGGWESFPVAAEGAAHPLETLSAP